MSSQGAERRDLRLTRELSGVARGLLMVVRCSPVAAIGLLVLTPLTALVAPILFALVGRAISLLGRVGTDPEAAGALAVTAVLIAVAYVVSVTIPPLEGALQFRVAQRFRRGLLGRLLHAVMALPGMAHFEDPEVRDRLHVAQWASRGPEQMVFGALGLVSMVTTVVGFVAVGAVVGVWLPLLVVVAAVPGGVAAVVLVRHEGSAQWANRVSARWNRYYSSLGVDPGVARESRVFGFGGWILGRHESSWLAAVRDSWRVRRRNAVVSAVMHLLTLAAVVYGYVVLIRAVVGGRIDVGEFAAASVALLAIYEMVPSVFEMLASMRRNVQFLPDALDVLALPSIDPRLVVVEEPVARNDERSGIRFEGVSFRYPRTDRPVLQDVDLWIPSGSTFALVGENGAGKTTLIKLLCRFYDPDEGRILIDGVDVRDLDLRAMRRRFSVIFQDFVRYPLPARDSVGFGSPDCLAETPLLEEAADAVGIKDTVRNLPDGWETPLSRRFGGVELSGGEWQRAALARAMMARLGHGADIMILDEPTANLDVRIEHDLYRRFARMTAGATTLLVSHRFSTVRMSDVVVALDGGRIAEQGSHAELLATGGLYGELYRAQAAHFTGVES